MMTPNNLVGLAKLAGLDVIAVTDHNTCKNAVAAVEVGEHFGILVIPGMEINTSEEIHAVCLFDDIEKAMAFDSYVEEHLPKIKNSVEIFGNQTIMNMHDEEIEEYPWLLTTATDISIEDIPLLMERFGGVAFPAHIDRDSYSILSVLGEIREDMGFACVELSRKGGRDRISSIYGDITERFGVLENSDAHYIENIPEANLHIELENLTAADVIGVIKRGHVTL